MYPTMDKRDEELLKQRSATFLERKYIKSGDFVRFADGTIRRVSHVWTDEPVGIQTSDNGSWYLGNGYMSFSGGLFCPIPAASMTRTDETMSGACWFFHHDFAYRDNGIYTSIPCPVWNCSIEANK